MDTRAKIIPLEEAVKLLTEGDWIAIAGLFDPLTAVQAARLGGFAQKGRKLIAVVLENPQALLEAEARAALIASLREVDAVTIAEPGRWQARFAASGRVKIIDDPEGERLRSEAFVRLILNRQQLAASPAGQKQ